MPRTDTKQTAPGEGHLPTAEAARALRRTTGSGVLSQHVSHQHGQRGLWSLLSLILTDVSGVAQHWIAPITNVGVVFEIFFMLGFGWFLSRWGFKG
jgi:hypothetical protein